MTNNKNNKTQQYKKKKKITTARGFDESKQRKVDLQNLMIQIKTNCVEAPIEMAFPEELHKLLSKWVDGVDVTAIVP